MSIEEELKRWLSREGKTFEENLTFAIKAWQAIELTFPQKHDVILMWFCDNIGGAYQANSNNFNWDLVERFLDLKCSPTLISQEVKTALLDAFVSLTEWQKTASGVQRSRKLVEVLYKILQSDIVQGVLRSEPKNYSELLRALFSSYANYVHQCEEFLPAFERDFFSKVLETVNAFIKHLGDTAKFSSVFRKKTLTSFVEVILLLKSKKLNYFEDLLEVERTLFLTDNEDIISTKFLSLPVHALLQHLECAIVHYRGHTPFLKNVLELIFDRITFLEEYSEPTMFLTVAGHILNVFRKQDINVNFQFEEGRTAIEFLGAKIDHLVSTYYQSHFYEILSLLCSAMRLNPLILEKYVFGILTKCLTARKTEKSWEAYQEFVILLMEMFRKLSRSEKFVHNLLKAVSDYLKENKISRKLKRKIEGDAETPLKKLKAEDLNRSTDSQVSREEEREVNVFLKILSDLYKDSKPLLRLDDDQRRDLNWPYIYYAWPSTVGVGFSKFISNLMSKPSMVVWKALMFSFADTLTALETTAHWNENLLFLIDFKAALLCQYLAGSRIAEHSDKFWEDIENNRNAYSKLLTRFCDILLRFEYNNRMMNALLEMCYHMGLFDMIRWNYCPDSISPESVGILSQAKGIQDYLTKDKWALIEQRIVNFGKKDCKVGINRLRLERLKACELILKKQEKSINIQKVVMSSTFTETDLVKAIFSNKGNLWIIKYLTKEQKLQICDLFLMDPSCRESDFLSNFTEIHDFLELILINIFKYLAPCFPDKKSVLASIDFDELLLLSEDDRIQLAVQAIKASKEGQHIKKHVPQDIATFLEIIAKMPVGYCKLPTKTLIFVLTLALYKDLLAAKEQELSSSCSDLLIDMLHVGEEIKTLHHFEIDTFFAIFPPSTNPVFYQLLFRSFKWMVSEAEICFEKIVDMLKSCEEDFNDDCIKLGIIVINSLADGSSVKKFKRFHDEILGLYASRINKFFADNDRDMERDKLFVKKTLPAYATYINWVLGTATRLGEIDDTFRKVCKIYIGHSMDYRDSHAIRLFRAAFLHRGVLHFDADEVEFVLQKYWNQMLVDVQAKGMVDKNIDSVVKLLIGYKSNADFAKILSGLGKDLQFGKFKSVFQILATISKSLQSSSKGALFSSYFNKITFAAIMKLKRDNNNRYKDIELVILILEAQASICENTMIPISVDLLDSVLCFLTDLSIKKFIITDTNMEVFYKLHQNMTRICTALMKCRYLLLSDRIPQFVFIFRDLLQAICWYKCDRQKYDSLDQKELEKLAELTLKLEALMHIVKSHAIDVKRVAPYLLTFVIHLMVTNNRPTTLYPTIKTPIESICYDLISVCDHRVRGFILRCSNDAMKQVYETLCKEFKKYHKFKGKV